jgi:hypothetical protein
MGAFDGEAAPEADSTGRQASTAAPARTKRREIRMVTLPFDGDRSDELGRLGSGP